MSNTIDYYNRNAVEYAEQTRAADVTDLYTHFEECLYPAARILDLGCGSGRDSRYFNERGYHVVPVDGSPEICRMAAEYTKLPVRCLRFSELDYIEDFDGIWACASLLHVPKQELPAVMEKVERALKADGVLYASFKYGKGEKITEGRHFSYYNEYDLNLLSNLGFIEYWISEDVRSTHSSEKWLNTLWRKM